MKHVIQAKHISGYQLQILFDDGVTKDIDFSMFLNKGPIFEPLRDPEYFKRFFVDAYTVCWPNGADIAPERLYTVK